MFISDDYCTRASIEGSELHAERRKIKDSGQGEQRTKLNLHIPRVRAEAARPQRFPECLPFGLDDTPLVLVSWLIFTDFAVNRREPGEALIEDAFGLEKRIDPGKRPSVRE
jgi:hypothetical protein